MKYEVQFEKQALGDIRNIIQSGGRAILENCTIFLKNFKNILETGTGNPEQLKYHLSGFWSRRLNKRDRLIYQIISNPKKKVVVISALGHYG